MNLRDSTFQFVHVPSKNCCRYERTEQVTKYSLPSWLYMAVGPKLSVLVSFLACMGSPLVNLVCVGATSVASGVTRQFRSGAHA